jgi:dienelactone hydrolase
MAIEWMPMVKARSCLTGVAALAAVAVLVAGSVLAGTADAPDLVVTDLRIPTRESGKKGLAAVMVRPNDSVPHPLALMTHGTPRDHSQITPLDYFTEAREFARRGWTTVVVIRRGFGDSGGTYAEDSHNCGPMVDYAGPTKQAAIDLRAAAAYLATRPEVDPSRMIAIGHSTGGLAVVGLVADPPPGLVAAISFAGGRGHGSQPLGQGCNPDVLVNVFAALGKRSRVSMLWVYAANDHYFGPVVAQELFRAYTRNGGKAAFILAAPYGEDGHGLFSQAGIPVWTPIVDDFLKSQNLVLRDTLLEIPPPAVEPPAYFSPGARDAFELYLLSPAHKAFAASQTGAFASSVNRHTPEDAQKHALDDCKKSAQKNEPCTVVMIDDKKTQD